MDLRIKSLANILKKKGEFNSPFFATIIENFKNMRIFQFTFSLSVLLIVNALESNCMAQQIFDENSLLIQQYFQNFNNGSLVSQDTKELARSSFNKSVILLTQRGDNNSIGIKKNGKESQVVSQVGSDNYYNFINYYNSNPSNLTILQQGRSNSLQIYGQNSIIENISIIQKSNFKSLVIKNY